MKPNFYKVAQAPEGYGSDWLIWLENPSYGIKDLLNEELDNMDGITLYMELESEDEARYWEKRFLKINENRFQGYAAYNLLVVSVNLPDRKVTFKQSIYPQGHNSYFNPKTGEVQQYQEPPFEGMSF